MGIIRSSMGRRIWEEDMTIEIYREMCVCMNLVGMTPNMIVNNRPDRILPGIHVGCVRYGVWGMHRVRMGRMGRIRHIMGRMRGEDQKVIK